MGSNRLISNKGEERVNYTSLTQLFEEQCPIYMSYGMTYDEFWHGECYRTKFYRDSHKIKIKQKDEEMWMQGMYIYEALCKVSPILHAFCKNGQKPYPYSDKPYLFNYNNHKSKKEKEKEEENAILIAQLHFKNWANMMQKRFKNKQGGE